MTYFKALVLRATAATAPQIRPVAATPVFGPAEALEYDESVTAPRPASSQPPLQAEAPPHADVRTIASAVDAAQPVRERSAKPPLPLLPSREPDPSARADADQVPERRPRVERVVRHELFERVREATSVAQAAVPRAISDPPIVGAALARAYRAPGIRASSSEHPRRRAASANIAPAAHVQPQSDISITIGRIDVRAVVTASATPPREAPATPKVTLEQFLAERGRGAR